VGPVGGTVKGLSFGDLPSSVGTVVTGVPFTLGEFEVEHFEKATWLDKAYPEDAPEFPPTLVEGFLLLSMLDAALKLSVDGGDGGDGVESDMWGLNYGLDRVRFVSQVHRGDRVLSTYKVLEVKPKDLGYLVLRRCVFTVEGHDRPAMTADWWSFVLPSGTVERGRREQPDQRVE